MNGLVSWLGAAALVLASSTARGGEGELEVGVHGGVASLQRHGSLNTGAAAGLDASFGLVDWLAIGAQVSCGYLRGLRQRGVAAASLVGEELYDTTRCTIAPHLLARFGVSQIVSLGVGAGYGLRMRSNRVVVSDNDFIVETLDGATEHRLIGTIMLSLTFRLYDGYGVAPYASATTPLLGAESRFDFALGVSLSIFTYP